MIKIENESSEVKGRRPKSVLITGGTGSFGTAFLKELFIRYPDVERVAIYSRDELKQWHLQQKYPADKYPNIRFFLGDVRDLKRLTAAFEGIDTVIHAAALKQVLAAEYNPSEFIKTNIFGATNIIQAACDTKVRRVIALSTDKASAPINLYGASKLCADKLFIAANNIVGKRDLSFSIVRYGNVMGSRGSVIPFFLKKAKDGFLPITDERMTRFNISLKEGVDMVFWVINNGVGNDLYVPKIPSYRIMDVANAIGPNCKKRIVGIRNGEKLHEDMITINDSLNTYDLGKYYSIFSTDLSESQISKSFKPSIKKVEEGFSYNSLTNKDFLDIDQLRDLIRTHVDRNFKPF